MYQIGMMIGYWQRARWWVTMFE